MAGEVAQQVQSIIEAAERAAAEIRRDAELGARRQTEGTRRALSGTAESLRRLSSLADTLVDQGEMLKSQCAELLASLSEIEGVEDRAPIVSAPRTDRRADDAAAWRSGEMPPRGEELPPGGEEMPPRDEPRFARAPDPFEPPRPPRPPRAQPRREENGQGRDRVSGARLVAMQMAVAGSTRREVEEHLGRAFGLDDPHQIVDDLFGSTPA